MANPSPTTSSTRRNLPRGPRSPICCSTSTRTSRSTDPLFAAMHPFIENDINLSRRHFFGDLGLRFGGVALAHFLGKNALSAAATPSIAPSPAEGRVHPALPGFPHF